MCMLSGMFKIAFLTLSGSCRGLAFCGGLLTKYSGKQIRNVTRSIALCFSVINTEDTKLSKK